MEFAEFVFGWILFLALALALALALCCGRSLLLVPDAILRK